MKIIGLEEHFATPEFMGAWNKVPIDEREPSIELVQAAGYDKYLYHLADGHRNSRVPEWFDLILILSFAWNGLMLGVMSTRQVERLLAPEASAPGRWVFLYPVMWLNALGVYIGRYLRYNSWDIVTDPLDLLGDIIRMIAHPLRYHDAWGMIFCFSILLTFIYCLLTRQSNLLEH